AFTRSDQALQRAASPREPSYRVRGILTDGVDSTTSRIQALLPGARLGNYLRHALTKLPGTLAAIASPVRKAFRSPFHLEGQSCQEAGAAYRPLQPWRTGKNRVELLPRYAMMQLAARNAIRTGGGMISCPMQLHP